LSQVRRWQSGVGHGPRLRSVRMTRTFQNGRERPTPCISGFFWRPQCTRFLHRGREQPPRFIVRFVCLYFPSCRSHNVGNHIARFCCLFLHFARLLSPALSVISRIVSAGRPRRLLDRMSLLLLIYKHISFLVTFQFSSDFGNDLVTNSEAQG